MKEKLIRNLKKNELEFQNKKYANTSLNPTLHLKSVTEYENFDFKPLHEGGAFRGELYGRTVNTLLQHDIEQKRILDYACGRGDLAIYLAQKGAIVSGFDVSPKAISVARVKANVNKLQIDFNAMDATSLDYSDDEFDFIIGTEALHHVIILPNVAQELKRVLKPNGLIIFGENWGYDNRIFQLWRELTTLRKANSADRGEVILGRKILDQYLAKEFKQIHVDTLSLLSMGKKYLRSPQLLRFLNRADQGLINNIPFLRNYCGEAIIQIWD